jgi:hypothetical protein
LPLQRSAFSSAQRWLWPKLRAKTKSSGDSPYSDGRVVLHDNKGQPQPQAGPARSRPASAVRQQQVHRGTRRQPCTPRLAVRLRRPLIPRHGKHVAHRTRQTPDSPQHEFAWDIRERSMIGSRPRKSGVNCRKSHNKRLKRRAPIHQIAVLACRRSRTASSRTPGRTSRSLFLGASARSICALGFFHRL